MIKIKKLLMLGLLVVTIFLVAPPSQAFACDQNPSQFFGIPDWHKYLPCSPDGGVDNVNLSLSQVWLIGIAVFEAILRIGAIAAMVFIMWGGVKYITSQGNGDATAQARKTIINAAAGLVILISASVGVAFLINLLDVGGGASGSGGQLNIPGADASSNTIKRVLQFVYAVVAVVAVIYIIIAAIKYALSTGDSNKALSARNTIIYAAVGLVIVLIAQTITNTVLDRFGFVLGVFI